MRLAMIIVAFGITGASAALAELPPYAYKAARASADSVIVVDIAQARSPRGVFSSGTCSIAGKVAAVERGEVHRPGQGITVELPCIGSAWRAIPGPFPGYSAKKLKEARSGRFFLRKGRLVLRGYDQLTPSPDTKQ